MAIKTFKEPIDLKIIKKKADNLFENRKIIVPILFTITGIVLGCVVGKGESSLNNKIVDIYTNLFFNNKVFTKIFFNSLIFPSCFFFFEILLGLSISGMIFMNLIPLCYSFIIGELSLYLYNTYALKGLAYCVLIIFPFASITCLAICFNCKTNYSMSQLLAESFSRKSLSKQFSIKTYCIELSRNYLILMIGVIIKSLSNYLFSDFFNF